MQLETVQFESKPINIYKRFGKRIFDVIVILLAAIPFGAVFGITYLIVKARLGSPVFFKQARVGYLGEQFDILKFRSMTNELDKDGNLLPDDQRLTKFGKLLRSSSLDELPELLLILQGKMSLVGPRPLPAIYRNRYTSRQMRRHDVLPGLTGWAQVNGRNNLTWEEKFELDLWYIDNQSLLLDLQILFMTVKSVLWQKDINSDGHATTTEFMGTMSSTNPFVD